MLQQACQLATLQSMILMTPTVVMVHMAHSKFITLPVARTKLFLLGITMLQVKQLILDLVTTQELREQLMVKQIGRLLEQTASALVQLVLKFKFVSMNAIQD